MDYTWKKMSVQIGVHVLTIAKLKMQSMELSDLDPYIRVEIIGAPRTEKVFDEHIKVPKDGDEDTLSVYQSHRMDAYLPGDAILRIQLFQSKWPLPPELLGELTVDLEDLWMALQARARRSQTNMDYLSRHTSPPQKMIGYRGHLIKKESQKRARWVKPQTPEQMNEGAQKDNRKEVT